MTDKPRPRLRVWIKDVLSYDSTGGTGSVWSSLERAMSSEPGKTWTGPDEFGAYIEATSASWENATTIWPCFVDEPDTNAALPEETL